MTMINIMNSVNDLEIIINNNEFYIHYANGLKMFNSMTVLKNKLYSIDSLEMFNLTVLKILNYNS